MAMTKKAEFQSISATGVLRTIRFEKVITYYEDGEEIGRRIKAKDYNIGDDISTANALVQTLAQVLWTQEYKNSIANEIAAIHP